METTKVRREHVFNKIALNEYLENNVKDYRDAENVEVVIRQFKFGQSNPTFYIKKGNVELVMRKKPPGILLPSAHQVDREYDFISSLFNVGFPVPKPLLYCSDRTVVGTEFYVMEYIQGKVYQSGEVDAMDGAFKQQLYLNGIDLLAKLHQYNPKDVGLMKYSHTSNHAKRQVLTWARQYKRSVQSVLPQADILIRCLIDSLPSNQQNNRIVHGDYRIGNMIIRPDKPEVLAVLDWELASIGDPLLDLAHYCIVYHVPNEFQNFTELANLFPNRDNASSEKELLLRYNNHFGISSGEIPHWEFYLALNFFRLAGIAQGIYDRALKGNASAANAKNFGAIVKPLIEQALRIIKTEKVGTQLELPSSLENVLSLFPISGKAKELLIKSRQFITEHCYDADKKYYIGASKSNWVIPPIIEDLKTKARHLKLWNLFLPAVSGLTQTEYALIAEETGRSFVAPECFNCSAPDTGNMEVLHLYGNEEQKKQWLDPLLNGEIRSAFCMTEPDVASSDATNMQCEIRREGDHYVINGRKWWSSGAGDPRCKILIVMGRSGDPEAPKHRRHSMILIPMTTPGVKIIRALTVFGYDDAPHGHMEIVFDNVKVPIGNMILGEGRGFEIAQGRLGPGRIHHCMRSIGAAERALELMCQRVSSRHAFGELLVKKGMIQRDIAISRLEIDQARLLTLYAARCIDTLGTKKARKQIAMAKIAVPQMACKVVDRAIQAFGAAGVSQDTPLAHLYAALRTLRIADGPDEVHLTAVAKEELKEQSLKSRL